MPSQFNKILILAMVCAGGGVGLLVIASSLERPEAPPPTAASADAPDTPAVDPDKALPASASADHLPPGTESAVLQEMEMTEHFRKNPEEPTAMCAAYPDTPVCQAFATGKVTGYQVVQCFDKTNETGRYFTASPVSGNEYCKVTPLFHQAIREVEDEVLVNLPLHDQLESPTVKRAAAQITPVDAARLLKTARHLYLLFNKTVDPENPIDEETNEMLVLLRELEPYLPMQQVKDEEAYLTYLGFAYGLYQQLTEAARQHDEVLFKADGQRCATLINARPAFLPIDCAAMIPLLKDRDLVEDMPASASDADEETPEEPTDPSIAPATP